MRLLYVCNDFGIPPDGTKGPSIHLRSITAALAAAGCEVRLLSPKAGPGPGHPVVRLLPPGCPPADESARLLRDYMTPRGLGDALAREIRPLLYNAWALDEARRALADRPVDVVLERLSLFSHLGLDLAEALDVPLVVEVNAILTDEARRYRALQRIELAETIERRVLERAAALLVVSRQLADQLAQRGVERDKIVVIPNGADVEHFDAAPPPDACRAALGLAGRFVVGFVGSLKVWHGADVLVEAFAKLHAVDSAARLLIVGAGPQEPSLRTQAAELSLGESAVFTGAVSHEQVPAMVRAMDVAVAPYVSIEGFCFSPIKLFEYMAAGACVVASRIGQIDEVVEHARNGLLCSPGNATHLFGALDLLRTSPNLRRRLAECGRETVRTKFTWAHTARRVLDVIGPLVAARAAASSFQAATS
ncbi:2-deoxystreptamine glucosyltransferase [Phycisphaerae bacterium RAS1]|nr:2-deoxystreptamine glucosyltransferase [Phycisphaerae bacterium RAS1]